MLYLLQIKTGMAPALVAIKRGSFQVQKAAKAVNGKRFLFKFGAYKIRIIKFVFLYLQLIFLIKINFVMKQKH